MEPTKVTGELQAMPPRQDDAAALEALACAARDGAIGAFDELARRLTGRLAAYARRSLGDRALADDAVQEAMVRIYRNLPRYRDGNFLGWAFTITARACSDVARGERRHRHDDIVEVPDARDHIDAADLRAAVEHALSQLPRALREVFVLRQQGLAYDDIASVLRIPIGTVRSRLHEARRLLRSALTDVAQKGDRR